MLQIRYKVTLQPGEEHKQGKTMFNKFLPIAKTSLSDNIHLHFSPNNMTFLAERGTYFPGHSDPYFGVQ